MGLARLVVLVYKLWSWLHADICCDVIRLCLLLHVEWDDAVGALDTSVVQLGHVCRYTACDM